MAQTTKEKPYYPGIVKSVRSGDTLVIMQNEKLGALEKTITLSSVMAPRLARRDAQGKYFRDEPLAWKSREYLRKLCVGKNVVFRTDYSLKSIQKDFGTVYLGNENLAELVLSEGLAKVREPGENKEQVSPFLENLRLARNIAMGQKLELWDQEACNSKGAIRDLPNDSNFDANDLIASYEGNQIEAIVEYVRDGTTLRVLLPDFTTIQIYVAGVQSPSTRKKVESNRDGSQTSTSSTEFFPNPIGMEAKHFTEMRVLNREYNNLVGSVYFSDGKLDKDLSMELVENGLAKYVEWSASVLDDESKNRLQSAELQAKNAQLKMWKDFVAPKVAPIVICNPNFTGKVIEVGSDEFIVVADDAVPNGGLMAERRVYLSSIRYGKTEQPEEPEQPKPYACEARELLRQCLIGRQVSVSIEYSQTITSGDESDKTPRVVDCGSVFLVGDEVALLRTKNVAEILAARGFATVVKHRNGDKRSQHYAYLLAAEGRAKAGRKGGYSGKDYVFKHISDRTMDPKGVEAFLPVLEKKKMRAIEYIFSGHRFKLYLPEESSYIAFSLSRVRCPGRDKPYSNEAISFMRRTILNRDVEVEVETADEGCTFLGSLWLSGNNIAASLLQAGLAKLQTYNIEKKREGNLLLMAQQSAKKKQLNMWEKNTQGGSTNDQENRRRKKTEMKVTVTDIVDGGRFYVQIKEEVASLEKQISALNLNKAPKIDNTFNPEAHDIVLARFQQDKKWYRVMVVEVISTKDKYEVFYIDYGNQEIVSFSDLRPLDSSIPSGPGLAKLCKLAYLKVPSLFDDYGKEAAFWLNEYTLNGLNNFRAIIETDDYSGPKANGQGTGPVLEVILIDESDYECSSVNATMLQVGLARLARYRGFRSRETKETLNELKEYQEDARVDRLGMWEYGDIPSDDDDKDRSFKGAGRKR